MTSHPIQEPGTMAEMHARHVAARKRLWNSQPPPLKPNLTRRLLVKQPPPRAKIIVGAPVPAPTPRSLGPTVMRFSREVAKKHGVTIADIMSKSRKAHVVKARRELCCRLHYQAHLSLSEIGRRIGRHPTSVLNLVGNIRALQTLSTLSFDAHNHAALTLAKPGNSVHLRGGVPAGSGQSYPQ